MLIFAIDYNCTTKAAKKPQDYTRVPTESNSNPQFWKIYGKIRGFSEKILPQVVLKQRKLSINLYAIFFFFHKGCLKKTRSNLGHCSNRGEGCWLKRN